MVNPFRPLAACDGGDGGGTGSGTGTGTGTGTGSGTDGEATGGGCGGHTVCFCHTHCCNSGGGGGGPVGQFPSSGTISANSIVAAFAAGGKGVGSNTPSWIGQTVYDGNGSSYQVPRNLSWDWFYGKYSNFS